MAFPANLMLHILSRLPVKSLVRFASVRKAWDALIRDSHFISQHLRLNISKTGCLVVKYRSQITRKHVISLLLLDGYVLSDLEIPSVMDSNHLKFVGSCNGLLCLAHDTFANLGSPIILWNPAMAEFRVLPDSLIGSANVHNARVSGVALGFGYHPLLDDYKLVRIVSLSRSNTPCIRAEVYSLRTDCWLEIDTFYFDIYEPSCTAVNGFLYWIAYGRVESELILSFDMRNEAFGQLQLPDLNVLGSPMCKKLAALKESLYLMAYTFSGRQKEFYVWQMVEQNAEVLWKLECTIGPLLGVERPLGCSLYGEIYIESSRGELVLYDPTTQETKNVPTRGLRFSSEVHFYVESLVSTNGQGESRTRD
ncbi:hypothetical protein EV1_025168 [Malus domestica]|nr:F-box/kelch-repeat protein At3g06240-like [Malus domestica]